MHILIFERYAPYHYYTFIQTPSAQFLSDVISSSVIPYALGNHTAIFLYTIYFFDLDLDQVNECVIYKTKS